jgi:5-methylcytosine-specific restriction endonuclease McrA
MNSLKQLIDDHHSNCREATKKKLYNSLISKRSRWAKENSATPQQIEELITLFIGKPCFYCKEKLDAKNISLDHINPIAKGGEKSIKNLTIICKRCNIKKGTMRRANYLRLLTFLDSIGEDKDYVLRKLASRSYF